MRVCSLLLAAVAVLVAVVPCPAQGQDKRERALALCQEGEALILAGKVEESLKKFKEALDTDIKCLPAHRRYQDILIAQEKRDKLLGDYREFVKIMPNSAMFNFLYGRLHYDDLDIEQKYLKKAVELDPKFFDARLALGQSYLAGKQYKEALDQFKKCEQLKPADPTVKFRMADVHLKLGDYDKARDCYRRVEQNFPENPVVKYATGCSYAYQGNHAEAVKHFEKADKLGFVDKTFFLDWAQSCRGLGKKKEAVRVYEKMFKTDAAPQDFAQIEQDVLSLCDPFSDLDPAQKAQLAAAIQLLEGNPSKAAEAVAALEELVKKAADSEAVQHMLGRALLATGKNDRASAAFKKAIELNPEYPVPLVYLALLDLTNDKYDSAKEKFLKALALDPFSAEANTYTAAIMFNLKKYKDALKYAKRACQVTGSIRDVRDILFFGELYLEDDALYLDEFQVGPWKVTLYKGMEQIDPHRAYAYRFVAKKDGKLDRVIAVNSRRVRDVDGPDPDALVMYHFLEETRRTGRGMQDKSYKEFGKVLPKLDDIIKLVKEILKKDAPEPEKKENKKENKEEN